MFSIKKSKFLSAIGLMFWMGLVLSCQANHKKEQPPKDLATQTPPKDQQYKTAHFASGCFWCVEAIFESVKGVQEVVSGYAGGMEKDPTYEKVSYGLTTHAEAVEVVYDPKIISFEDLVKVFFDSHDPTTRDGQGPDKGAHYRSIVFYDTAAEHRFINGYIAKLEASKVYAAPIVTEVAPFLIFYPAEAYHQDFEKNNPNNPYIRNVSVPRLKQFEKKHPDLLKESGH